MCCFVDNYCQGDNYQFATLFSSKLLYASQKHELTSRINSLHLCHQVISKLIPISFSRHPEDGNKLINYPLLSGTNAVQKTYRLHAFYIFYSLRLKIALRTFKEFLEQSDDDLSNREHRKFSMTDILTILLFEGFDGSLEDLMDSQEAITWLWKIILQSMKGFKDAYTIDKYFFRSIYRQSDAFFILYQMMLYAIEKFPNVDDLKKWFPVWAVQEMMEIIPVDDVKIAHFFSKSEPSKDDMQTTEFPSSFDSQSLPSIEKPSDNEIQPSNLPSCSYQEVLQAIFHPKYALQELRKLFDRQRVLIVSLWVNNTSNVLLWESLLLRKSKYEQLRNKVSPLQCHSYLFSKCNLDGFYWLFVSI